MIRETGWTITEYRQQPMGDVFDLVAHLHEEPPAYRILAWRYLKPKPSRSRSANPAPLDRDSVKEITQTFGARPQAVPQDVRDRFAWAQEQMAKMGKKSKRNA